MTIIAPPPAPTNWIEVLEQQAHLRPNQLAFTESSTASTSPLGCEPGQLLDKSISYSALSQRVKALAVELQRHSQFGDRVLMVMPAGIDYVIGFFACIYANVIAVTAYPPNSKKRDWARLSTIVRDCDPSIVLYHTSQQESVASWLSNNNDCAALPVAVDSLQLSEAKHWQQPSIDGNDIAYFQYSSGSTGNPKGVMLSHLNLLSNTRMMSAHYGIDGQDRLVNWLPLYHDMGLVGGVLMPLLVGAKTWILPSATVAQQPFKLLKLISDIKATATAGPNFIFDLAVSKISADEKKQLDLSSLKTFVNGAEPINAKTLVQFSQYFAEAGLAAESLKPSYGMAEACLMVTATSAQASFKVLSVDKNKLSLGKAVAAEGNDGLADMACSGELKPEVTVKIVHQGSRALLPDGYVGEIMIKGDCVSQGYWQKPELNQTVFNHVVDGQNGFMTTGDLGFIDNNQLYVSGRCKEMFIVNGRNHYPQDIESTLSAFSEHLYPHGGAVFEVPTDEFHSELILVQELTRKGFSLPNHQQIIEQVTALIAQVHELKLAAVILIKPMTLPKTSSGKIQRIGCRDAYLQGQLKTVASWHRPATDKTPDQQMPPIYKNDSQSISQWILHWVAQRLNMPTAKLSPQQQLAQMGLDSIDAMSLTHELSQQLDLSLNVDLSWSYPSIQSLSDHLAAIPATTTSTTTNATTSNKGQRPATPPMEGTI